MDLEVTQDSSRPMEAQLPNIEDEGNKDGHIVDIDKWAASIETILEDVPEYMCRPGHPGRVSRIPQNLREVDAKSYEPYLLSIGPYHNGKPSVQRMEITKHCILKWVLEHKPQVTLQDYLMEIKSVEPLARSFYSDVDMDSEEFVRMLLLDSLYIVTVFCGMIVNQERMNVTNSNPGNRMENEDIYESTENEDTNASTELINTGEETGEDAYQPRWLWNLLEHDLFLLENQVPFFVLQMVHRLAYGGPETQLIDTIKYAFIKFLGHYRTQNSGMVIAPTEEVHHLLHLCHMFFRPILQQNSVIYRNSESSQMFRLGNAVQLYEAGVTFEARPGSSHHTLLDITVDNNGKMYMPCLYVQDKTISLLRNLIALEQMKYPTLGLEISAYAVLLLHLITIPEDVELLRRFGIIHHHLASDKEMVYVLNKLSVGLSFDYVEDNYKLKQVFHDLKRYSERRTPRWRAWLQHRYFDNPWMAISLFAASLLLLLTVVQTYYTMLSFYHS